MLFSETISKEKKIKLLEEQRDLYQQVANKLNYWHVFATTPRSPEEPKMF